MTAASDAVSLLHMNREQPLLSWQWSLYPDNHRTRRNLLLHLLTVPLFEVGTLAVVGAFLVSGWLAIAGVLAMAVAMALQGAGHGKEAVPPVPFASPFDALARIFVEQWVTFPRYVLSGQLAARWRAAPSPPASRAD
jgi:hypothetical protein